MKDCRCPSTQACKCTNVESFSINGLPECGECLACQRNQQQLQRKGKRGQRACHHLKNLKNALKYDCIIISDEPHVVLRMSKEKCPHPYYQPQFQLLYRMRMALMLQLQALDIQLVQDKQYVKKNNAELFVCQERLEKIKLLPTQVLDPKERQAQLAQLEMLDSDAVHDLVDQKVNVHVLMNQVKENLRLGQHAVTSAQVERQSLRHYVETNAASELQRVMRGCITRQRCTREWLRLLHNAKVAAAVVLQNLVRQHQAWLELYARRQAAEIRRQDAARRLLQRTVRGYLSRCCCRVLRAQMRLELEHFAASVVQRNVRRFLAKQQLLRKLAEQREARREGQAQVAVTDLQRFWRGYVARKRYRQRKIENSLNPQVRRLAEQYIQRGDLWEFLGAVSSHYNDHNAAIAAEEENCQTFMDTVLVYREQQAEKLKQDWYLATIGADSRIQNFQRTQTAYHDPTEGGPPRSPLRKTPGPTRPTVLSCQDIRPKTEFQHECTDPAGATTTTAATPGHIPGRLPRGFDASIIRRVMAQGYTLNDTATILRGLQAQGKSTTNMNLILHHLEHRAPLMINSYRPERVIRKEQSVMQQLYQNSSRAKKKSSCLPTLDLQQSPDPSNIRRPISSFSTRNITRDLPRGLQDSVTRLVKLAALRTYDPVLELYHVTEQPFEEYLAMSSPVEKSRRESRAHQAVESYIQELEERGIVTIDMCHRVTAQELVEWGLPSNLAQKILELVRELKHTTKYLDPRVIRQETCVMDIGQRTTTTTGSREAGSFGPIPSLPQYDENPITTTTTMMLPRPDTSETVDTILYQDEGMIRPGTGTSSRPGTAATVIYELESSVVDSDLELRPISRGRRLTNVTEAHSPRTVFVAPTVDQSPDPDYPTSDYPTPVTRSMLACPASPRSSPNASFRKRQEDHDSSSFQQLKHKLEQELLQPTSLSDPLHELVFQSVFRICPLTCVGTELRPDQGTSVDNLEGFIQLLTQVQTPRELREMVRERTRYAASIAGVYVSRMNAANVTWARDLAKCPYEALEIPPLLVVQLRQTLAYLIKATCVLDQTPKSPKKGSFKKQPRLRRKPEQLNAIYDRRFQTSAVDPTGRPPRLREVSSPQRLLTTQSRQTGQAKQSRRRKEVGSKKSARETSSISAHLDYRTTPYAAVDVGALYA